MCDPTANGKLASRSSQQSGVRFMVRLSDADVITTAMVFLSVESEDTTAYLTHLGGGHARLAMRCLGVSVYPLLHARECEHATLACDLLILLDRHMITALATFHVHKQVLSLTLT